MTDREIYKIWAPYEGKWSGYARPVDFIKMKEYSAEETSFLFYTKPHYMDSVQKDTAIVVDLPCEYGIEEGIGLASIGYRPVPTYNGTFENENSVPTTNNKALQKPLYWGATILKDMKIPNDAPPAFLVDTNRLNRHKMNISIFDNSYDMYAQDFPTATNLLNNGINKVIVRSSKVNKDMRMILNEYQKSGIQIFITDGFSKPKLIKVSKPLFYKN